MSQPAVLDTPPAQATPIAWDAPSAQATPDHYAIVTPEGRFEVSQLSDRGLYRSARYSAVMDFAHNIDAPPAPPPAAEPTAPANTAAPDRQVLVYDATEAPDAEGPPEPQLADASGARVIDVAVELAARGQQAH
jgi:hypothetical protein